MTSGYGDKRWEVIKRLFNALAAVSDSRNIASILYTAVISAGVTKDRDFMLSLLQHIPEAVEEDILA
ncbi:MAG: hypothetical protein L3J83_07105 [Proteobacteria bacterium]|nr:hypothetical protein [Pseudomonadota bacterium]